MKPEGMLALVIAAQQGVPGARDAVVAGMLPYVHMCVSRRLGHHDTTDPLYQDCMQAAVVGTAARGGLLRAIDTFDASRGLKFSTHAANWIRAGINDTASDHPVIRIGVRQRHIRIRRVAHAVAERLGRAPSVAEVRQEWEARTKNSKQAAISDKAIAEALSSDVPPGWTVQGLESPDLDREALIDEDTVIDAIDRRARLAKLQAAIESLPRNERMLVEGLFGFGGGKGLSIAELAKHCGCSKVTVTRRRNAVIAKLKALLSE